MRPDEIINSNHKALFPQNMPTISFKCLGTRQMPQNLLISTNVIPPTPYSMLCPISRQIWCVLHGLSNIDWGGGGSGIVCKKLEWIHLQSKLHVSQQLLKVIVVSEALSAFYFRKNKNFWFWGINFCIMRIENFFILPLLCSVFRTVWIWNSFMTCNLTCKHLKSCVDIHWKYQIYEGVDLMTYGSHTVCFDQTRSLSGPALVQIICVVLMSLFLDGSIFHWWLWLT